MAEPQTAIEDALTERQIQVGRVETHHRAWVWDVLDQLGVTLLAALRRAAPTEPTVLAWRKRRVEQVLAQEVAPAIEAAYGTLATENVAVLVGLAQQEARAVRRVVAEIITAEMLPEPVPLATLRQAVTQTLFPSVTTAGDAIASLPTWWERLGATLTQRLGDHLRVSVGLEEPLPAMLARVQGTPALGHQDGLLARAKKAAASLVRTAVTMAVSVARQAVAAVNSDTVRAIEHVSVLDDRTTTICQARDGLRYTADTHEPLGHSVPFLQGIPYHIG